MYFAVMKHGQVLLLQYVRGEAYIRVHWPSSTLQRTTLCRPGGYALLRPTTEQTPPKIQYDKTREEFLRSQTFTIKRH